MTIKLQPLALALALTVAAGAAQAQDNVFKGGAIFYQAHSKTTGITGIGIPPGADAEVGDAWTALFTYERMLRPDFGIELVLGFPPTIEAKGTGSVAFLGDDVLSAKIIAPTVLFNYHFGTPGDTWRPYVGIGFNYTRFVSIESRLASDVQLSDSVGLAGQVGINYFHDKNWGAFASIGAAKVESDLLAVESTVLQTTIDFRPITYSFGLSYRF
jgi:outer membrane protein